MCVCVCIFTLYLRFEYLSPRTEYTSPWYYARPSVLGRPPPPPLPYDLSSNLSNILHNPIHPSCPPRKVSQIFMAA